jgi:ABC-type multidrug transport system ATPase subunit
MLSADAGSVTVMGKNIDTQMSSIRENIGICLQHDCLFPWLTVEEHVYFFARVKGLFERKSAAEAKESIIESIENVGLKDKQYTLSTNLSGILPFTSSSVECWFMFALFFTLF